MRFIQGHEQLVNLDQIVAIKEPEMLVPRQPDKGYVIIGLCAWFHHGVQIFKGTKEECWARYEELKVEAALIPREPNWIGEVGDAIHRRLENG